jgi:hypothetical protein
VTPGSPRPGRAARLAARDPSGRTTFTCGGRHPREHPDEHKPPAGDDRRRRRAQRWSRH